MAHHSPCTPPTPRESETPTPSPKSQSTRNSNTDPSNTKVAHSKPTLKEFLAAQQTAQHKSRIRPRPPVVPTSRTADHPLACRLDSLEELLLAERSANINLRNEVNDQRLSQKIFDENLLEYIKATSTSINPGKTTIPSHPSSSLAAGLSKDISNRVDREEDLLSRERVRQLAIQLEAATQCIDKVESDNATLLTRVQEMELRLQSSVDLQHDYDSVFKYHVERIHVGPLGPEGLKELEKTLDLRKEFLAKKADLREKELSGTDQKETAQDSQQQMVNSITVLQSENKELRKDLKMVIEEINQLVSRPSSTPVNVSDLVALPTSTPKVDHGAAKVMTVFENKEKAMLTAVATAEKAAIKSIDKREKAALKTITDLDNNAKEAIIDYKCVVDGEKAALASLGRNRKDSIAALNQQNKLALAAIAAGEQASLHTISAAKEELLKHVKAINGQFSNTQSMIAQSLNLLNKTRDDAIASIKKLQVDVGKGGGKEKEKQLNAVGYKWQGVIEKLSNKTQQATSDAKKQALVAIQTAREEVELYVVAHKAEMVQSIEITGVNESDKLRNLADEITKRVDPCHCGICLKQKQKKNSGISDKKAAITTKKNQRSTASIMPGDNEEISEDSEDYEDDRHGDTENDDESDEGEKLWKDEWPKYWEGAGPEGLGRERDERDVD